MTRKCGDFSRFALEGPPPLSAWIFADWMERLARDQHRDELLDPGNPGFRLLGVVNPIQDRIAIGAVECFEKRAGLFVPGQRGTKIVGHLGRALRRIGGIPAPVLFGALDLAQSGRPHPFQFHQLKRASAIFLRPFAGGLPRREAHQPIFFVEGFELAVDPAVAQRGIDSFRL